MKSQDAVADQCTKSHVQTVALKLRCHSNQLKADRSILDNNIGNMDDTRIGIVSKTHLFIRFFLSKTNGASTFVARRKPVVLLDNL